MPWWAWMILGALLGLAEMLLPSSYLIWIAMGAALTGAVRATFEQGATAQIATFAIASGISCVAGYFVYRSSNRSRSNEPLLNERGQLMIGARGVVCSAIVNGEGKVRLGDSVWLAEGADLPQGAPIVVRSVRGARVTVESAV